VQQSVAAALAITERNVNPQAGVLCRLTIGWLRAESQDFEGAAKCGEETLNAAVEANPFNFFIGRSLLAKAYIGLGNLPLARAQLDAIDQRIEAGIAMESLIAPQYFFNRCEYWLAAGDLDQAQQAAERLHEITAIAPDRPFLALSHSSMARVAMAAGNLQEAGVQLSQAISIVQDAQLPLAAWRVYAVAANFYESIGEVEKAVDFRFRSDQVKSSLISSLEQSNALRSAMSVAHAAGR